MQFTNCMTSMFCRRDDVVQERSCLQQCDAQSRCRTVASPRVSPLGSIEYSLVSLVIGLDSEYLCGHWSIQLALLFSDLLPLTGLCLFRMLLDPFAILDDQQVICIVWLSVSLSMQNLPEFFLLSGTRGWSYFIYFSKTSGWWKFTGLC